MTRKGSIEKKCLVILRVVLNPTGRCLTVLALKACIHCVQKSFMSSHWKMEGHLRALICLYGAKGLILQCLSYVGPG